MNRVAQLEGIMQCRQPALPHLGHGDLFTGWARPDRLLFALNKVLHHGCLQETSMRLMRWPRSPSVRTKRSLLHIFFLQGLPVPSLTLIFSASSLLFSLVPPGTGPSSARTED